MNNKIQNEIKLLALDIDGTTLRKGSILSDRTCLAIRAAIEQGVEVVFATGRMLDALPSDLLEKTGVQYVITSNGANVVDLEEERSIYKNTMDIPKVEEVIEVISDYELLIEALINGSGYMDETWLPVPAEYGLPETYVKYALRTRRPVKDLLGFMRSSKDGIESINLNFGDPSMKQSVYERLITVRGITITSAFTYNLEVGAATANKGDGVRALCDHLKISYEATMACGDNENDLAMIKFAALSVAVDNAVESIKLAAHHVVSSNEEDGVAEAIERFILR